MNLQWPQFRNIPADEVILVNNAENLDFNITKIRSFIERNQLSLQIGALSQHIAFPKDTRFACERKDKGNTLFKSKKWKEAKLDYLEAIKLAPPSTELLALGYANLAAVQYHLKEYEQAIESCSSAIHSGSYPSEKIFKIYQRRSQCYAVLGRTEEALTDLQTALVYCKDEKEKKSIEDQLKKHTSKSKSNLSISEQLTTTCFEPNNPYLANATDKIQVRYDNQFNRGRYIIAMNDLSAGEILIQEEPYASALFKEHENSRCHHCFRPFKNIIPCNNCSWSIYCSEDCKISAQWYHVNECKHAFFRFAPPSLLLCLRILLHKQYEESVNSIEEDLEKMKVKVAWEDNTEVSLNLSSEDKLSKHYGFNYKSVDSLLSHIDEYPSVALMGHIFDALLAHICLKDILPSLNVKQLVHHLCQLRTNVHAIYDLVTTTNLFGNQEVTQTRIAEAIYTTSSLLNHSCSPNTSISYDGNILTVRASEVIANGTEVTHCYGPHFGHMRTQERKDALLEQYFFECNCEACLDDTAVDPYSFKCTTCGYALTQISSTELNCIKCRSLISYLNLKQKEDTANDYFTKGQLLLDQYLTGVVNIDKEKIVSLFQQCAEIRRGIYLEFHPDIAAVEDAIAHVYAEYGDFHQAVNYCRKSVEILEQIYGEESVEMGHEYAKLAQLLFNDMQAFEAMNMVEKAKLILTRQYGRDHPTLVELEKLRKILLSIFEKSVGPYWST